MASSRCADCSFGAVFGSRCATHWVARQARSLGITEQGWWHKMRPHFTARLVGRYVATVEGFEPPPMTYTRNVLNEIIARADALARKEHDKAGKSPGLPGAMVREAREQGEGVGGRPPSDNGEAGPLA